MSSARLFALMGLACTACLERPPPPGSGAVETTPTGSVMRVSTPAQSSGARVLACPNGSVATSDPKTCRVALLRDGIVRWDRELSGCGGILEVTVAMDSSLFVRTPKTLSSFTPEGALSWATKMDDPALPQSISAPTSLPDSRGAVAVSKKSLVVYERDGKVSWTFAPPSEEEITAPPEGMRTEGVILMTTQATYYLGATGEIRWRVANASVPSGP